MGSGRRHSPSTPSSSGDSRPQLSSSVSQRDRLLDEYSSQPGYDPGEDNAVVAGEEHGVPRCITHPSATRRPTDISAILNTSTTPSITPIHWSPSDDASMDPGASTAPATRGVDPDPRPDVPPMNYGRSSPPSTDTRRETSVLAFTADRIELRPLENVGARARQHVSQKNDQQHLGAVPTPPPPRVTRAPLPPMRTLLLSNGATHLSPNQLRRLDSIVVPQPGRPSFDLPDHLTAGAFRDDGLFVSERPDVLPNENTRSTTWKAEHKQPQEAIMRHRASISASAAGGGGNDSHLAPPDRPTHRRIHPEHGARLESGPAPRGGWMSVTEVDALVLRVQDEAYRRGRTDGIALAQMRREMGSDIDVDAAAWRQSGTGGGRSVDSQSDAPQRAVTAVSIESDMYGYRAKQDARFQYMNQDDAPLGLSGRGELHGPGPPLTGTNRAPPMSDHAGPSAPSRPGRYQWPFQLTRRDTGGRSTSTLQEPRLLHSGQPVGPNVATRHVHRPGPKPLPSDLSTPTNSSGTSTRTTTTTTTTTTTDAQAGPSGTRRASVTATGPPQRQPISCYLCRSRKLKCDGISPCAQCVRRNNAEECEFAPSIRRRGKQKKRAVDDSDDMSASTSEQAALDRASMAWRSDEGAGMSDEEGGDGGENGDVYQ